ncbi:transposable element, partial [Pseudoloma neurophilia]
ERKLPDLNEDFVLECDASNTGIAAILKQMDDNGEERIVIPYSRKLNKHERNCRITEKVLFAIIEGLDKFGDYTHGKKIIIISDHKALTWLQS